MNIKPVSKRLRADEGKIMCAQFPVYMKSTNNTILLLDTDGQKPFKITNK